MPITLKRLSQAFLMNAVLLSTAIPCTAQPVDQAPPGVQMSASELGKKLEVGDVVFIQIPSLPFRKVADTTSSWTNHVGMVTDVTGTEPVIAESRVPFSGETTWSRFVERSDNGRVAITRLPARLDQHQQSKLKQAVAARRGILYDAGFDLHSRRQFCSRYVREVLDEAVGVKLGEIENFSTLLNRNPQADQTFWRVWYFGSIPWQRETVTPASLLRDGQMQLVFDGRVQNNNQYGEKK